MFGTKGISKRVAKAVDPTLRTGENKIVSVYLHDLSGSRSIGVMFPETPLSTVVKTWIVTLTDQRVIVHNGNEMNAARSEYVGDASRDRVTVLSSKPSSLVLSFDGDEGHRFSVPRLWRKEAAQFVDELHAGD